MDTTNMPQVSVIPDAEEKRAIRLKYNKVAVVLIINTFIFNVFSLVTKVVLEIIFGEEIWTDMARVI